MKPTRPHIAKGRTYSLEFREEAVCYWLSSGQTWKSVASDLSMLGMTPECLRTGRQQLEATLVLRAAQRALQVLRSMSRKGNCYDNAVMESFWATFKTECSDNFRADIPTIMAGSETEAVRLHRGVL